MPKRRRADGAGGRKFPLFPLAMTLALVIGMALLTIVGLFGLALGAGVAAGAACFLAGAVVGGRLGNARQVGQSHKDAMMRLGACLALVGITAGAQGHDPPFTERQRLLIGLGQAAASILAVVLAKHSVKQIHSAKETEAADDSAAKLL